MQKSFYLALFLLASLISCNDQDKKSSDNSILSEQNLDKKENNDSGKNTANKIAVANGLNTLKNISEIRFTFNVDKGADHSERSWIWYPKKNKVTQFTEKDTITYDRNTVNATSEPIDQAFINDQFWLLTPFNLVWDTGISFKEEQNVEAPISKKKLNMLTATYISDGGYTPGDAYDLFYDENYKIQEWIYRKGNAKEPSLITTWEDYKNYNGIEISTMRKNKDESFKLYFTNIEVITDSSGF